MKAEKWLRTLASAADGIAGAAPITEVKLGAAGAAAAARAVAGFLEDGRSVEELIKLLQAQSVKPIADDLLADPTIAEAIRQKGG